MVGLLLLAIGAAHGSALEGRAADLCDALLADSAAVPAAAAPLALDGPRCLSGDGLASAGRVATATITGFPNAALPSDWRLETALSAPARARLDRLVLLIGALTSSERQASHPTVIVTLEGATDAQRVVLKSADPEVARRFHDNRRVDTFEQVMQGGIAHQRASRVESYLRARHDVLHAGAGPPVTYARTATTMPARTMAEGDGRDRRVVIRVDFAARPILRPVPAPIVTTTVIEPAPVAPKEEWRLTSYPLDLHANVSVALGPSRSGASVLSFFDHEDSRVPAAFRFEHRQARLQRMSIDLLLPVQVPIAHWLTTSAPLPGHGSPWRLSAWMVSEWFSDANTVDLEPGTTFDGQALSYVAALDVHHLSVLGGLSGYWSPALLPDADWDHWILRGALGLSYQRTAFSVRHAAPTPATGPAFPKSGPAGTSETEHIGLIGDLFGRTSGLQIVCLYDLCADLQARLPFFIGGHSAHGVEWGAHPRAMLRLPLVGGDFDLIGIGGLSWLTQYVHGDRNGGSVENLFGLRAGAEVRWSGETIDLAIGTELGAAVGPDAHRLSAEVSFHVGRFAFVGELLVESYERLGFVNETAPLVSVAIRYAPSTLVFDSLDLETLSRQFLQVP